MNIWEILHIEATTDKRAIKKAYALCSKTIHPEEKPEEFKQLYEAYQMALQYAKCEDGAEKAKVTEIVAFSAPRHEEVVEEKPEVLSELTIFFTEQKKYREFCMENFQRALERMYEKQGLYGEAQAWQSYLKSKEFKEIQMDSQIIMQMTKAVQGMGLHTYEFSLNLWEVYGLREDKIYQYHGALKELCRSLTLAKSKEKEELDQVKKIKEKERRKKKYFFCVFVIFVLFFGTIISVCTYQWFSMSRNSLNRYMAREYPGTEFSKPERQKSSIKGWDVFSFHTLAQPEIAVRARVKKDSDSSDVVENYGAQRIRKIKEIMQPYDLNFYLTKYQSGKSDLCVFDYSDIGEMEEFSSLFYRFYEAEKNNISRYINWVGFYPADILHPQVLLEGGVAKELWNTPIFELNDLPEQAELLKSLQNSWIQYMYFYEPWNLTPEQQKEYEPRYLELVKAQGQMEDNSTNKIYGSQKVRNDVRAIEKAYGLYLPIQTSQSKDDKLQVDSYMTIGTAYQYLNAKGLKIAIYHDRSGFSVYSRSRWVQVGEDLKVSLDRFIHENRY